MNYKGYRVGSIEKSILKFVLNVNKNELPNKYSESFSGILKTARQKSEYGEIIKRMKKKGLISFINKNDKLRIILTNKGKNIAREYSLENYKHIKRPLVWDKKWRMVMFDIPEKRRAARNVLREKLKEIGGK